MITSHRNRDTGIIETVLEGDVTFEEVSRYINELSNPDKFPQKLLILTDAVKGRFSFTREEDLLITDIVMKYAPLFREIRDAIIIDDPRTTAYSLLYRTASAHIPNYHFEVFSTRKAAIKWLLG